MFPLLSLITPLTISHVSCPETLLSTVDAFASPHVAEGSYMIALSQLLIVVPAGVNPLIQAVLVMLENPFLLILQEIVTNPLAPGCSVPRENDRFPNGVISAS